MDPTGVVMGAAGLVMAGLVVWLVTRSASRGAIEVNAAIGIRTRLTQSSQRAWEAGHLAALPWASAACALAVVGAAASVAAIGREPGGPGAASRVVRRLTPAGDAPLDTGLDVRPVGGGA